MGTFQVAEAAVDIKTIDAVGKFRCGMACALLRTLYAPPVNVLDFLVYHSCIIPRTYTKVSHIMVYSHLTSSGFGNIDLVYFKASE